MTGHLNSQQIGAWILGERDPEVRAHVRNCAVCRAEVTDLGATLSEFRGSVRDWAEQQPPAAQTASRASALVTPVFNRGLAWAALVILFCFAGALRLWRETPARAPAPVNDAALLQAVDSAVSKNVPGPMEPLMRLVTADGTDSGLQSQGESR